MTSICSTPCEPGFYEKARRVKITGTRYNHDLYAFYDLSLPISFGGSTITIYVPDGFESDGPSWPNVIDRLLILIRSFMVLIGMERFTTTLPDAHMIYSSAIHDFVRERLLFPKFVGDWIFLKALKAEGCNFWFRWMAFFAVLTNFSRLRSRTGCFNITEQS